MAFGKLETGLIIGTFVGNLVGSGVTILVMKKLKKLEYKRDLEAQQKQYEEVYAFYNNKIEELKKLKNGVDYAAVEVKKSNEKLEKLNKISNSTSTVKVTADGRIDEEAYNNPKTMMQERQAADDGSDGPDPSDFNIGTGVLERDNGWRPKVDYAKISREKYSNLTKEYEREELVTPKFPHQITKDMYERAGGYIKEEVMYYEQNGIFADLEDNIVDHLTEEYFGIDNINLFGTEQATLDGKNDLYEIYLRDEELHTDYHIIYNGTEDFEHLGDCR